MLVLAGCGKDASLASTSNGDCAGNILPGDHIVRSRADADALEKEGKCNYTIAGDLEITRLNLALFEGLNQLSAVDGNLTIHDNDELKNFEGLNDLASVGGDVTIYDNEELVDLKGLSFLSTIGGHFSISHNRKLTAVDGLIKLNAVAGNMRIDNNNQLANIDGLFGLAMVGGSFTIAFNPSLELIEDLSNLSTVGGDLVVEDNLALTALEDVSSLKEIGGSLRIGRNAALDIIEDVSSLTRVGQDLSIYSNSRLTSIAGLASLSRVGGSLNIYNNEKLITLAGLESLEEVAQDLNIYENEKLTSLAGLASLVGIGGNVLIVENGNLPTSEAQALADRAASRRDIHRQQRGLTAANPLRSHPCNNLFHLGHGRLLGIDVVGDDAALAQYHDPVHNLEDVVDVVGDENAGVARVAGIANEAQDALCLRDAQIVGRLVENDELAVEVHGPRNGHGLALAARQRTDGRRRGNVLFNAHLLEQGAGHIRHGLLVHAP